MRVYLTVWRGGCFQAYGAGSRGECGGHSVFHRWTHVPVEADSKAPSLKAVHYAPVKNSIHPPYLELELS